MLWFNASIVAQVKEITKTVSIDTSTKISITGETGTGKRDLLLYCLSQLPERPFILEYLDFQIHSFTPFFFIRHAMKHYVQSQPEFKQWIKTYSELHRKYLVEMFDNITIKIEEKFDWYNQIFLEFLGFVSQSKIPVLTFENINQLDSIQFGKLQNFIETLNYPPLLIIFTTNPAGPHTHVLKTDHQIILTRQSIQTTESLIRNFFDTSSLNARLITNHCFLKTGGNLLKIRLLSSAVYSRILKPGQKDVLNIKSLQHIKVPETWDQIFSLVFFNQNETTANLLAFLAHVNIPIEKEDFDHLIKELKIKQSVIRLWTASGILRKIYWEGTDCFILHPPQLIKWLRSHVPVENLSIILQKFSVLMDNGKLRRIYQISDLLFDIGHLKQAVVFACREGFYFKERGDFERSADRFYFVVRNSDQKSIKPEDLEKILDSLSEIYLFIGGFENAFEILKKLRALYTGRDDNISSSLKSKWLRVNLKMAEALVEMDSFQEARYLIRETRVKKFCDTETIGRCYELIGDIESNLAHSDQAWRQYRKALGFYSDTENIFHLIIIYSKLKNYLSGNSLQHLDLIQQILKRVSDKPAIKDFHAILLRDKIQLLLKRKLYMDALKQCYLLWNILRQIYQPKLRVQLVFYLSEIYSQIGKWQLALSHLKKINSNLYVKHRPELNVQTLIQLGMIYKEQAMFGQAQKILNNGMEICFRHGFHEQINEIKLHLGHIYLLVHGLLRSFDFLREVVEWSEKNQRAGLLFLAKLYLSYYEAQHKRFEKARSILSQAKKLLNLSNNVVDYLNYLFYFTQWSLEINRLDQSQKIIEMMIKKSRGYPRYQASGYYLLGRLYALKEEKLKATRAFQKAEDIAIKCNFPYIKYLTLCEKARSSGKATGKREMRKEFRKCCKYIDDMAVKIDDAILSTQFLESGFHEDILQYCKENKLLKMREPKGADQ